MPSLVFERRSRGCPQSVFSSWLLSYCTYWLTVVQSGAREASLLMVTKSCTGSPEEEGNLLTCPLLYVSALAFPPVRGLSTLVYRMEYVASVEVIGR